MPRACERNGERIKSQLKKLKLWKLKELNQEEQIAISGGKPMGSVSNVYSL